MDDIILTDDNLPKIASLKLFLHNRFKIKDMGVLNYFMGIKVAYSPSSLFLHQHKFIYSLLLQFDLVTWE